MTVLRARALDSQGNPVAGRTAVLEAWTGNRYKNPYSGPSAVRGLTAVSGSDGWLSWTLPALQRRPGPRGSLWVITGLEAQPVVLATQPTDTTTTGIRVGTVNASGDLVPVPAAPPVDTAAQAAAAAQTAVSTIAAGAPASLDTLAEVAAELQGRLSDTNLKALFGTANTVPPVVQQAINSAAVNGQTIQSLAAETGYVWAQVDQAGKMALGIRADGTVEIIKPSLPAKSVHASALADDVALPATQDMDAYGYATVWVDQNQRIAMWLTMTGALGFRKLDQVALDYLAVALGTSGALAPTSYLTPEGVTRGITSGPDIVCWGDSLTAGAGSGTAGGTYPGFTGGFPTVLATLTGRTVRNAGVGGENSVTIAARTGATPFLLLPANGQVPASGDVTVTLLPINGTVPAPLLQGNGTPGSGFTGSLAGVPGTLSQSSGVYTFSRTNAGTAVPVTRPVAFRTDFSAARRGDIPILWLGQNGPSDARSIADDRAVIEHLAALHKRWLVISRPTGTDAIDQTYHDEFGRRFISVRRYLVDYGLADAGITATTQDTADIAAGNVPTSLRIDGVHGNAAYYNIVAQQVNARLRELGWV